MLITFLIQDTSGWRWFNCFLPWYPWGWNYETDDYDYNTVIREIDAGRPVYLKGWSSWWTGDNKKAHIWVADGYKKNCYVSKYKEEIGRYNGGGIFNKIREREYDYISGIEASKINMNWGWSYDTSWVDYNYWQAKGKSAYEWHKGMITVKPR